jgi:hypothetical protein
MRRSYYDRSFDTPMIYVGYFARLQGPGGFLMFKPMRLFWLIVLLYAVGALFLVAASPQTSDKGPTAVRFTATTENVSGAGEAIKINLTRWSSDTDRDQFLNAWNFTPPPAAESRGAAGGGRGGRGGAAGGRGGRGGGGRGGRGATAPAGDVPADPDAVDPDNPAFRFGRGGARGGAGDAAPESPQASLASALKKAPTVGILWTSETVGYSIKYAYRLPQPDGTERVILATDRRVGAWSNLWRPVGSATVTDYAFSVIELHLNAKGEGEGKTTMTGKVASDNEAKTIVLDAYNTLPVILKGVKRQ